VIHFLVGETGDQKKTRQEDQYCKACKAAKKNKNCASCSRTVTVMAQGKDEQSKG